MNRKIKWTRFAYILCIPALICTMCMCSNPKSSKKVVEEPRDYSELTVKPTFNGKDGNEFAMWLHSNIEYPEVCKEGNISGRVVASFTIDSKGKVTDIQIVRGVHEELDNAVVKALEKSPAWTPGEVNGKTVPVRFTLPIVFQLR